MNCARPTSLIVGGVTAKQCHVIVQGVDLILLSPLLDFSQLHYKHDNDGQFHYPEYGYFSTLNLGDHGVVIDIGANLGMAAIMLANLYPELKVLSYEASPRVAAFARANCELNGLVDQITITNEKGPVYSKCHIRDEIQAKSANVGRYVP